MRVFGVWKSLRCMESEECVNIHHSAFCYSGKRYSDRLLPRTVIPFIFSLCFMNGVGIILV